MYRLHVPINYTPAKPAPLLVALHGGGGDMNFQDDDKKYKLITKSDNAGFIVVFHSWNGCEKTRGGEPASKAISANDVMWDFFKSK
ncbi:MAG: hypothetical protein H7281_06180 [Bacteriovorax sp.]|nr:hypothetical protein [Bacteriovorax sp.]